MTPEAERAKARMIEVAKHTNQEVCICESCVEGWADVIRAAVAEERERITTTTLYRSGFCEGATMEREACARVAELACYEETPAGNRIAAAIRARGER